MTTKSDGESGEKLSEEYNEEQDSSSSSKVSQVPPIPPKPSLLVQKLRAFGAGVTSIIGSTNPKVLTLHQVQSRSETYADKREDDAFIIGETEPSLTATTTENLKIKSLGDEFDEGEGDPWAEAVVSPCVHHNLLTTEITIPIPPSSSTSHTSRLSMSLHNIESYGSGEAEIMKEVIEVPTNDNEEVHCPLHKHGDPKDRQGEDGTLLHLEATEANLILAEVDSRRLPSPSKSQSLSLTLSTDAFLQTRPALEGMRENGEKEDEAMEMNTVIVSKLQELVIKGTKKSKKKSSSCSSARDVVEIPELRTRVENPQPHPLTTCIKYKVHQSPNGVTTISIDPKADPVTLATPPSIIHHIINLPPRRANFIRNRRRKTEDFSYQKSSRLSQLMMTDYKTNTDRPNSVNLSNSTNGVPSTTAIGNGIIEGKNIIKGNVESMGRTVRRKVGSWYRRRVKTPVEQFSLGFESIRFPMFKCSSSPHDGENCSSSVAPPTPRVHENQDAIDGCSPEPEEIESPTDQRFVEGLACDQGHAFTTLVHEILLQKLSEPDGSKLSGALLLMLALERIHTSY